MLTLHLTLDNGQIHVRVNGKESHQFSLHDLTQSKTEWEGFQNNPRIYGEKLFNVLFRDAAKVEFDALSKQTERTIVLVLESPELDGVAWEYAYNKAKEEYVVEDCAFVRALPESERPANGRLKAIYERVPLLFIPANPLVDLSGEPMHALDVEGEWKEISKHINPSNAGFDLLKMLPATPEQLQTVMARFHDGLIVHFSGHGGVEDGKAILLFEEANGASHPLNAREFVREIKDKAAITFLSSCQSAVAERTEFSNLARGLVKAGVPFALGMQFNLPDPFASNISGQFYNYLTRGHGVPEAARQARRAVKREHEFFVGMIALYAAHPDEIGILKWIDTGAKTLSTFRPANVSDLPSPASGLIGRQRELMRIGTQLLEGKKPLTVTLHGAGGIGKTALLWQALLRFAPSFELTLAIGLDPLPSLESVLGRIERFLFMPSPCSNDTKERETLVRNALVNKRTLLGLDNFETLNYALNEKGSDEEKTAKSLHAFFKSLAANGVMLCVTSREVTNLPGETIEDIQGLTNESGGRLFQENVVRQKDDIYIEKTQQVSEMVGGHPLALRLLASAFDDQVGTSLDQYIESLQSFLPKARDKWTEENRHESLRASFDFTMNNLSKTNEGKELQIALAKLSVFIAFFADFTAAPVLENKMFASEEEFTQMRTHTSSTLNMLWERSLLERATHLLPEENFYLYRLHPALRLFAKPKLNDAEADAMQENYWQSMNYLAFVAEEQTRKSPLMARVMLGAVPDLIFSAGLKLHRDGALMQHRISMSLQQFGLYDDSLALLTKSLEILDGLDDLKGKSAALHQMANIYFTRGDLDKAMQMYGRSLEIDEGLVEADARGKSATLHAIANILRVRGDLNGAMKLYEQSLEIKKGLGDLQGKAVNLHSIAGIYVTRGDLDRAMKLYGQSLELFEELGDLKGKAGAIRELAKIYATRGDLDKATEMQKQTLGITKQLGDQAATSVTLNDLANIYVMRGGLDVAMQLYRESLEISEELGDLRGKADTLNGMAYILRVRGDLESATQFYRQSLEIQERLGDQQGKADTLHAIAGIYVAHADLDKAMSLYRQSLEIFEGLGDQQGKAVTIGEMSKIYSIRGVLDKAIELQKQKLVITEQLRNQRETSVALHDLGNIYVTLGDLDGAMQVYEQSLEIKEGLEDLRGKSATLTMMAGIYVKRKELERAMKLYGQSLELFERLGDLQGKAVSLHEMGYILHLRKDLDGAMRLYRQSLELFERLGNLKGKANTLGIMSQIDAKHKDYREALEKLMLAMESASKIGASPGVQTYAGNMKMLQSMMGYRKFETLWKEVTGEMLPDWLVAEKKRGILPRLFKR